MLIHAPELINEAVTCSAYSSFEDLADMQEEWDGFVESMNGDIYLSFDWCRIWWEYYGDKRHLRIYLFHKDNNIVGIIPVFHERLWIGPVRLKIAKTVGADFTISMVNPPVRAEFAVTVFSHVVDSLIQKEKCDAVWFGPIGGEYEALPCLREAIGKCRAVKLLHDSVRSPYTIFFLPKTFEDYIQSLDKRERSNVRRSLKQAGQELQMTQDVIQDAGNAGSEFEKFVRMHTEQWKTEGKLGHFHDWPLGVEFNARMATEQAKKCRLKLLRLITDGKVISYQLCYAFGNRWYWRLPARLVGSDWDKYALGRVGLVKKIEFAISEGVQKVESGAGHYDYKVRLGGKEFPLYSIILVNNKWFCRLRACLFMKFSSVLHFCYYRVWFGRLASKLPFKRRPLWKIWIRTRL